MLGAAHLQQTLHTAPDIVHLDHDLLICLCAQGLHTNALHQCAQMKRNNRAKNALPFAYVYIQSVTMKPCRLSTQNVRIHVQQHAFAYIFVSQPPCIKSCHLLPNQCAILVQQHAFANVSMQVRCHARSHAGKQPIDT